MADGSKLLGCLAVAGVLAGMSLTATPRSIAAMQQQEQEGASNAVTAGGGQSSQADEKKDASAASTPGKEDETPSSAAGSASQDDEPDVTIPATSGAEDATPETQGPDDSASERIDERSFMERPSREPYQRVGRSAYTRPVGNARIPRQGDPEFDRGFSELVTLSGQAIDYQERYMRGSDHAHTLLLVRTETGGHATVNLGPNLNVPMLNLRPGDRVTVQGRRGRISGTSAIMASTIWIGNEQWSTQTGHSRQGEPRTSTPSAREGEARGSEDADAPTSGSSSDERDEEYSAGFMNQDSRYQQRQQQQQQQQQQRPPAPGYFNSRMRYVEQIVAGWPQSSRENAQAMIQKYGLPSGATSNMLIWQRNDPWFRTIVFDETIDHRFPMPHEDVLEQIVVYDVPADKMDELAEFSGSIIVYRTAGHMSSRCHNEAVNILALNLAHEIVQGTKSVDEARQEYTRLAQAYEEGHRPEYMQKLMFKPESAGVGQQNPGNTTPASIGRRASSTAETPSSPTDTDTDARPSAGESTNNDTGAGQPSASSGSSSSPSSPSTGSSTPPSVGPRAQP